MRAEKLHAVAYDVFLEYRSLDIPGKLSGAVTALRTLVAPVTAAQVDELTEHLRFAFDLAHSALAEALEASPSNGLVPSRLKILEEIGGNEWTGLRLLGRVDRVLTKHGLQTETALAELELLKEGFDTFHESLNVLVTSMGRLGIGRDKLPADKAEFGAILPLEIGDASLDDVQREIQLLDRHLRVFTELTGETPASPEIRSVGSDSLELFVLIGMPTAWMLATVIEKITVIYNNVLDIRLKHRELSDRDFYPELKEAQVKDYVDRQIDLLREEVKQVYRGEDEGRANELNTALGLSLRYLADRVDRGGSFEINVLAPASEVPGIGPDIPGFTTFTDMKSRGESMVTLDRQPEPILPITPTELLKAPEEGDEDSPEEPTEGDDTAPPSAPDEDIETP